MKTVRIWLLLLLAVLLPLRGAVAAAMLCPVGGTGVQVELSAQPRSPTHEVLDHDAMAHEGHAHHHASPDQGHDHHPSGSDKCNMCSAFCSLTPLVSSVPTLAEPVDLAAVEFSEVSAPPPNFFSDGQERPPRTL